MNTADNRTLLERVAAWNGWIEVLPDLVSPAEGLGRLDPMAARALRYGELQELLAETEAGLERSRSAQGFALRGRVRRLLGLPGSGSDLGRALRLDPGCREARAWRAELWSAQRPEEAARRQGSAPDPAADVYRAAALGRLGRWRRAARVLTEAVRGPEDSLPRLLLGLALLRSGRPQEALTELDRASGELELAAVHWLRASACWSVGDSAGMRAGVDSAMRLFSELDSMEPLLGSALRADSANRIPSERTLRLLGRAIKRLTGPAKAWALVVRAETFRRPQFLEYEQAVALLKEAAALEPGAGWIQAYLGRALEHAGDAAGALEAFDRAVTLEPGCGWSRAWRGQLRRRRQDPGALPDLDLAARLAPEYPFVHAWRGGALRTAGRLEEAVRELELAIRLEPMYEWSYAELSLALKDQGRYPEAARFLAEAHEREPKFVWARRDDAGACGEALAELDRALTLHPGDPFLRAWRAWLRIGGQPAAAAQDLASARDCAFEVYVRAEAEAASGRNARAMRLLDRAVGLKAAAAYLGARGILRWRTGDLRGAVKDLERAVRGNDTTARFWCALGAAWSELGSMPRALRAFDRALGLDPNFPEALAQRAEVWRSKGNSRRARKDLARSLALRPDSPWAAVVRARIERDPASAAEALAQAMDRREELPRRLRGRLRSEWRRRLHSLDREEVSRLAESRLESGDAGGALEAAARLIRISPADPRGWALRARGLYQQGQEIKALEDMTQALARDPRQGWIPAWHGLLLRNRGDLMGALASFERALALDAGLAWARAYRGEVRLRTGDMRGALADFEEALGKDPQLHWARVGKAAAFEALGETENAAAALRELKEASPEVWQKIQPDLKPTLAAVEAKA